MPTFKQNPCQIHQSIHTTADAGTRIGLENWRSPYAPDEHASLLDEIAHPAVGATLDVGHIAYCFQHEGVTSPDDDAPNPSLHDMHDVHAATLQDHRTVAAASSPTRR